MKTTKRSAIRRVSPRSAAIAPAVNGPTREVPFYFVDVFTDTPLAGNPLAVVADCEFLDDATMRRIAREFNQSETTFVLPPTRAEATWRLRCFTPTGFEAFGAGHNALGAWWWIAHAGRVALKDGQSRFLQELGDRVLPVEVIATRGQPLEIIMTQTEPEFGAILSHEGELASSLGLDQADFGRLPKQVVSTGAPHLLVHLRNRAAIDRAKPDVARLATLIRSVGGQGCYLFGLDPLIARFFNPVAGIPEDPATGSAAGPLAAFLIANKVIEAGTIVVEQGHALERLSRIEVRVQGDRVEIAGRCVVTARGTLTVTVD
jgi:trans-2,3-dihydro-3-hydroxyanthranilate isomerase